VASSRLVAAPPAGDQFAASANAPPDAPIHFFDATVTTPCYRKVITISSLLQIRNMNGGQGAGRLAVAYYSSTFTEKLDHSPH